MSDLTMSGGNHSKLSLGGRKDKKDKGEKVDVDGEKKKGLFKRW